MIKYLALIAIWLPASLLADTYDCVLDGPGRHGNWISERIMIQHDRSSGNVRVADALTIHSTGGAVPAEISTDNGSRITFLWSLANAKDSRGQVSQRHRYRGTYVKRNRSFSVSMSADGYSNTFQRRGYCTLTSG